MTAQTNTTAPDSTNGTELNLVLLTGAVRTEPKTVELDDGTIRLTFEVLAGPGTKASPVTWTGPVSKAPRVAAGRTVSVTGQVRRFFFQSGGTLGWQTDILATEVAVTPAKRRALMQSFAADVADLAPS